MSNNQKRAWYAHSGNIAATSLLVFVASLAAAFIGIVFGQKIIDSVMASSFSPSQQVAMINDHLKLTDDAKTIFYASKPSVDGQEQFNQNCQSTERTTAMLGCYYQRKIYLFNITNQEMKGAVEVTAAHEMLHAAYERIPFYEKDSVNKLILAEYEKVKSDKTIKDLVSYYEKAEPGSVTNELHSIIGTTVATIDPKLETYFARYFTDRQAIVAMNESYNSIFRKVQDEADLLSKKIEQEGPLIEKSLAAYEADRKQLEMDIQTFNQRAASGEFKTQSSFQVARSAMVSRSNDLNARRDALNARVDEYNTLIEKLRALSVRSEELNKSINGISTPKAKL